MGKRRSIDRGFHPQSLEHHSISQLVGEPSAFPIAAFGTDSLPCVDSRSLNHKRATHTQRPCTRIEFHVHMEDFDVVLSTTRLVFLLARRNRSALQTCEQLVPFVDFSWPQTRRRPPVWPIRIPHHAACIVSRSRNSRPTDLARDWRRISQSCISICAALTPFCLQLDHLKDTTRRIGYCFCIRDCHNLMPRVHEDTKHALRPSLSRHLAQLLGPHTGLAPSKDASAPAFVVVYHFMASDLKTETHPQILKQ